MIRKDKVLEIIHNIGGCDGTDDYEKGWDDAINEVYDEVSDICDELEFTTHEISVITLGLGLASKYIGDSTIESIMKKLNLYKEV